MDHQRLSPHDRTADVLRYRSIHAARAPLLGALVLITVALAGFSAATGDVVLAGLLLILAVGTAQGVARSVVEIDVAGDVLILRTGLGSETRVPIRTVESVRTSAWSGTRLRTDDGRSWIVSASGAFVPLLDELHRHRPGVGAEALAPALDRHRQEQRLAAMRTRHRWTPPVTIALTVLGLTGLTVSLVLGVASALFLGSSAALLLSTLLAPVAFAVAPELDRVVPVELPSGTPIVGPQP